MSSNNKILNILDGVIICEKNEPGIVRIFKVTIEEVKVIDNSYSSGVDCALDCPHLTKRKGQWSPSYIFDESNIVVSYCLKYNTTIRSGMRACKCKEEFPISVEK